MREYQVELMVAAQDDEGSTMRIEELERRKNLAESVAQRIFDKGMIMREESTRTKSRAFRDFWVTLNRESDRWNVTVRKSKASPIIFQLKVETCRETRRHQ